MARGGLPAKDTEPIAVTTHNWPAGHPHLGRFGSGEYLASWYVGQIAEDAVSGFVLFLSLLFFSLRSPFDIRDVITTTRAPNDSDH